MINKKAIVERHFPHLTEWNPKSPLSLGNARFAYTADITGMQTFYQEQKEQHVPLCTMSEWGWHTSPAGPERNIYYDFSQVEKTKYDYNGREVSYAVDEKPGNEEIYNWLRQNPHRMNLGRIGFIYNGNQIHPEEVFDVEQTLNLYEGTLQSHFEIEEKKVEVLTVVAKDWDSVAFSVHSEALMNQKLAVQIAFPYGYKDITASDWNHPSYHTTTILEETDTFCLISRTLDKDCYYVLISKESPMKISLKEEHVINIFTDSNQLSFCVSFTKECNQSIDKFEKVKNNSQRQRKEFWENTGAVSLYKSKDPKAMELERRIVLSKYLLAIQCSGNLPPQETGLTVNSWYGKFHLEMYPWHCAYLPLWNQTQTLKNSMKWYKQHLEDAKINAKRNAYKGARWPKMVAYDAIDSPSCIATLLVWQQPHIIYMLELAYLNGGGEELLTEYWEVVKETAEFMCDFLVYEKETDTYNLVAPLIPAQEEHDPEKTKNPVFEVEYFYFTLKLASLWAKRLGENEEKFLHIAQKMAPLAQKDGLYLAHEDCLETFEKFNRDHPSMVGAFGFVPGERVDAVVMKQTLDKVLDCWDYSTLWGWDFAMMAMTAIRLGDPQTAIDILLRDIPKNSYVASGNNYQELRTDLPLYLPGNGSLMLVVAMMTAGFAGCSEKLPGFPKNGMWEVEYEDIQPLPY